jgi:hypothetical protein
MNVGLSGDTYGGLLLAFLVSRPWRHLDSVRTRLWGDMGFGNTRRRLAGSTYVRLGTPS